MYCHPFHMGLLLCDFWIAKPLDLEDTNSCSSEVDIWQLILLPFQLVSVSYDIFTSLIIDEMTSSQTVDSA